MQRPEILSTVSKDLYVLRRAAEVYQRLIERFAPQQRTDYVALLNEWAVGFYTELDFVNEGNNQMRMKARRDPAGEAERCAVRVQLGQAAAAYPSIEQQCSIGGGITYCSFAVEDRYTWAFLNFVASSSAKASRAAPPWRRNCCPRRARRV